MRYVKSLLQIKSERWGVVCFVPWKCKKFQSNLFETHSWMASTAAAQHHIYHYHQFPADHTETSSITCAAYYFYSAALTVMFLLHIALDPCVCTLSNPGTIAHPGPLFPLIDANLRPSWGSRLRPGRKQRLVEMLICLGSCPSSLCSQLQFGQVVLAPWQLRSDRTH